MSFASIYFTKKKSPEVDLRRVRVPAKVIVLRSQDPADEEALISDTSRYANSQNAVRQSDLSANKPFHVELEKLALTTYCPDGVGRWFYERAAGSYNTMLAREEATPAHVSEPATNVGQGSACRAPSHLERPDDRSVTRNPTSAAAPRRFGART
jgi:hypothetical protein